MQDSRDSVFVFEYLNHRKYIKFKSDGTYEEFIMLAKQKFSIDEEQAIFIKDKDGVEIDKDFFDIFISINKNENIPAHLVFAPVKALVGTIVTFIDDDYSSAEVEPRTNSSCDDNSSTSTLSNSPSTSFEEEIEVEEEKKEVFKAPFLPKNKLLTFTSEDLELLLMQSKVAPLVQQCKDASIISNDHRKKLVNCLVDIFISRHGYDNSKWLKCQYNEAFVNLFPSFKNPYSSSGGYEQFYDPNRSSGYFAWRLSYLHQRSKDKKTEIGTLKRKRSPEVSEESEEINEEPQRTPEIDEAITFLKNACPKSQMRAIVKKTEETFKYRRTLKNITIAEFPRFFDTPGLINKEFDMLHPEHGNFKQQFIEKVDSILDIYKTSETNPFTHIVPGQDFQSITWDKFTRAVLALLYLYVTTHGKRAEERLPRSAEHCWRTVDFIQAE